MYWLEINLAVILAIAYPRILLMPLIFSFIHLPIVGQSGRSIK
ncbi:hypothetical protein [Paenibacillus kandeliae]